MVNCCMLLLYFCCWYSFNKYSPDFSMACSNPTAATGCRAAFTWVSIHNRQRNSIGMHRLIARYTTALGFLIQDSSYIMFKWCMLLLYLCCWYSLIIHQSFRWRGSNPTAATSCRAAFTWVSIHNRQRNNIGMHRLIARYTTALGFLIQAPEV